VSERIEAIGSLFLLVPFDEALLDYDAALSLLLATTYQMQHSSYTLPHPGTCLVDFRRIYRYSEMIDTQNKTSLLSHWRRGDIGETPGYKSFKSGHIKAGKIGQHICMLAKTFMRPFPM
jgi:hypothetical protein